MFTSKLNCSSAHTLWFLVSINVTKSSLFPTAIVFPSGDHVIFMFSPFVLIIVEHFPARTSHIRTVLSPLAVLSKSGIVACQHNWSTEPVWPLNVVSLANRSRSSEKIATDLSKEPDANLRPSQFHPTEWTWNPQSYIQYILCYIGFIYRL